MLSFLEFLTEAKKEPMQNVTGNKDSDYYYHITRGRNMQSIAKNGLMRNGGPGGKQTYPQSEKLTYLTASKKKAMDYAGAVTQDSLMNNKSKKGSARVIRIRRDKIDKSKLSRDSNSDRDGHYEYDGDIPAKDITFSGGVHLKKFSAAWKKARQVNEGNPLARVHHFEKKNKPTAAITAYRSNLSPEENKKNMKAFDADLKGKRYGFRKVHGSWEGGGEPSRFVTAHGKGNRHVKQFKRDMEKLGQKYDQDAVALRHDKETTLLGTNDTGYPGKGKLDKVGKTAYNVKDSPFQTEFRPRKPPNLRPKFTTKK